MISYIRRGLRTSNYLTSPNVVDKSKKSPLFLLRQQTGLAYNLCREALDKHDNDVVKAGNWLQAQALAHGLQKATKIRGRSAREGIVGLAIQKNNKIATVLELNCETDFVVKNQFFKDFALGLTEQVASAIDNCSVHNIGDLTSVIELKPPKQEFDRWDEQIVALITRLGENIKIQRASHFQVTENNAQIFAQIHAQAGEKSLPNLDIMSGRFGAIVALRDTTKTDGRLFANLGNRLCRHVIGYNPTYIELPDDIRLQLEEAEKQKTTTGADVDEDEEKYSDQEDNTNQNSRDDWPSIMDQQLILSDDQSVRDFCKQHGISIVHFKRFECGGDD